MTDAAAGEASSVSASPIVATPQERIDFLKHSMAFAEHNIRSYDTKAQISLAAFLISMSPLWNIVASACDDFALRGEAVVLVLLFLVTISLYCFVLWPIRSRDDKLVAGLSSQNLFYVKDPLAVGSVQFKKKLE